MNRAGLETALTQADADGSLDKVTQALPAFADQPLADAEGGQCIYVRWSDDGQFIRKWSREPFEGAAEFRAVRQEVGV